MVGQQAIGSGQHLFGHACAGGGVILRPGVVHGRSTHKLKCAHERDHGMTRRSAPNARGSPFALTLNHHSGRVPPFPGAHCDGFCPHVGPWDGLGAPCTAAHLFLPDVEMVEDVLLSESVEVNEAITLDAFVAKVTCTPAASVERLQTGERTVASALSGSRANELGRGAPLQE